MQSLARKINNLVGITTLGQGSMANSLPVVFASDQSMIATLQINAYQAVHIDGATLAASPITNYAIGDAVGNKMTLLAVSEVKATLLQSIALQAAGVGTGTWDMDILIFSSDPTTSTITDDAPIVIGAADYPKVDAIVSIVDADWKTIATRKFCVKSNLGLMVRSTGNVYAAIVAKGVFDGPANNLEITFGVIQG